jgi:hypothetical protein
LITLPARTRRSEGHKNTEALERNQLSRTNDVDNRLHGITSFPARFRWVRRAPFSRGSDMTDRSEDRDPVNFSEIDRDPDPKVQPPGSLYVPPHRRHGISHRIARNEVSKAELLHHLLGAYAEDTLTGALGETQILAEMLADMLEHERHMGTLARHIANRLEVLTGLAEQAEEERTAT